MKSKQEQDIEKLQALTGSGQRTCGAALRAAAGNLETAERYINRFFDYHITDIMFQSIGVVAAVTNQQQTRGAIIALRFEDWVGTYSGEIPYVPVEDWAVNLATILCERGEDAFEAMLYKSSDLHPFVTATSADDFPTLKILYADVLEGVQVIPHHYGKAFYLPVTPWVRQQDRNLSSANTALLMALNRRIDEDINYRDQAQLVIGALTNAEKKMPDFEVTIRGNASVWPGMTQVYCLHRAFKTETLFDKKYDLSLKSPGTEVFVTDFRHAGLWCWESVPIPK